MTHDDGQFPPRLLGYALTGVGGVRGEELAYIGPLGKMNFLVGRNNHGKSTLMKAAAQWVRVTVQPRHFEVGEPMRATLIPFQRIELVNLIRHINNRSRVESERAIDRLSVRLNDDNVWVGLWVKTTKQSRDDVSQAAVQTVFKALGMDRINRTATLETAPYLPDSVVVIPAFRLMRPAGEATDKDVQVADGAGLVGQLAVWQRPPNPGTLAYDEAKARWDQLAEFVRDVLEDPEAELEVSINGDLHVHLAQANTMLRIEHLGDGIKQVLMIAAACLQHPKSLILLEEPEIHLHAGLQRKLMRFLNDETPNQYIVATHSAHVLDLPGARIFHVTHDGTSTRVAPAVRASEVHKVCHDLGYMASDLLQANYTVWVEGPSDRIYWRQWLKLLAEDLEEGVHFVVMTYGGYLVDGMHIRDEGEASDDLIALLKLGRACTLIADSDKKAAGDAPRRTLVRLADEASNEGSGTLVVCDWASTVENLLPRAVFRDVVKTLHPRAGKNLRTPKTHRPFDDPFKGMKSFSKVKVARAVVEELNASHIEERLRGEVLALARRIRTANGLPVGGPT